MLIVTDSKKKWHGWGEDHFILETSYKIRVTGEPVSCFLASGRNGPHFKIST